MTFRDVASAALTVIVLLGSISGCGGASEQRTATPAPAGQPAAATGPRVVDVAADRGWQDTGITLRSGQPFQLRYRSGQIVDQNTTIADGKGSDYVCGDPGCCEPFPDEHRGMLIGKIGTDQFVVGNGGSYTASSEGALFLRINDCDSGLADNKGSFSVEFIP